MKRILIITIIAMSFFLIFLSQEVSAGRLFTTGFETRWLSNNGEMEETCAGAPFSMDTSVFRTGTASLKFLRSSAGTGVCGKRTAFASENALYTRFYLNISSPPGAQTAIMFYEDNNGGDMSGVDLTTSNTLQMTYRNTGGTWTDVGTPSVSLSNNTWYRVELYTLCSNTTQITIELRLNGTLVATATQPDAICGGTNILRETFGSRTSTTGTWYFDDIAINDDDGTNQNSWPEQGKIVNLFLDGAAGDNNNALSGTCVDVDDNPTTDSATTVAVLDDNNDILDCAVEDPTAKISINDTIKVVHVGYVEAASSATSGSLAARVKSASGGTVSTGSTQTHDDTSYRWPVGDPPTNRPFSLTSYTDPTTSVGWAVTGTNSLSNMQIGVTSIDADPDMSVSQIAAVVEFVPPPSSSNNYTNGTGAGTTINHSVNWTDAEGLNNFVFSFDNGNGTFLNDTSVGMTGTANQSNITKVVNSTGGATIRWMVYANNSANAFNVTDTFSYTTTSADSCTCTDGTAWTIINGDQCTLSTTCNLGANPLRIMNGALRITSTGKLNALGCYVQNSESLFVAEGGGLSCR